MQDAEGRSSSSDARRRSPDCSNRVTALMDTGLTTDEVLEARKVHDVRKVHEVSLLERGLFANTVAFPCMSHPLRGLDRRRDAWIG
ncbi:uncharacterized protein THITE_2113720 [Thermothielavioides terrestris NRRL 8126]|uniref:Uncharacterized protein n=1 Tax=Thermothielavioides terrestris (strain ATCC 38088 / NRRL 8126) TaxID=578455 RepID=G2R3V3_THETT|nr:uncharacterized protein THITE_2113720 [Thermothielavioides terrestris NRRL 8126]AEO66008.1 hypothetical protein THITE_2113720 [Thermothielavioides terrestris NRRL 8126]